MCKSAPPHKQQENGARAEPRPGGGHAPGPCRPGWAAAAPPDPPSAHCRGGTSPWNPLTGASGACRRR
eukprot:7185324-Alexandrium_andersonii.AAC.1